MTDDTRSQTSLSATRVFVVQFCPTNACGEFFFKGRGEQLTSGHVDFLSSPEELCTAFDKLMDGASISHE